MLVDDGGDATLLIHGEHRWHTEVHGAAGMFMLRYLQSQLDPTCTPACCVPSCFGLRQRCCPRQLEFLKSNEEMQGLLSNPRMRCLAPKPGRRCSFSDPPSATQGARRLVPSRLPSQFAYLAASRTYMFFPCVLPCRGHQG